MGKKEAVAFLKKSNKSIIKAWETYKSEIGRTENTKLDDVFQKMFKAWTISNQKAIDLLESKPHNERNPTKNKPKPKT
ncbi:MAG: hypothetical protein K5793_06255 [Nitrosarchaeum sp.]|nr:hypothetical protein [Nitrosarchaeum sp.]MCV0398483.1 hypothetical protein [Nitrosarchaeum sp.]